MHSQRRVGFGSIAYSGQQLLNLRPQVIVSQQICLLTAQAIEHADLGEDRFAKFEGSHTQLGFRFRQRHIEHQIVIRGFITGPSDHGGFFGLDLLPAAGAFSAKQSKIVKI